MQQTSYGLESDFNQDLEYIKQEMKPTTLAEAVYEGWVKKSSEDGATIELRIPNRLVDIDLGKEDFLGGVPPKEGSPVRYQVMLQTAPDLEDNSPVKDEPESQGIRRLKSLPGRPGVYVVPRTKY